MITLNSAQKKFIKSEFGIRENELNKMTKDEWQKIRLKAFDIEAELLPADENIEPSERCKMATSIIDLEIA